MKRKRLYLILAALLLVCIVLWVFSHDHARRKGEFPQAIVVHESASRHGDAATIRSWHLVRGFGDIGYHAVILNGRRSSRSGYDPRLDGKIEPGRPETVRGCHCEGDDMNAIALGVCLIGFPGKDGYPTNRQMDALVYYLAVKCRQYEIPVSAITQHSDHDYRKPLDASLNMPKLRSRVQAELIRLKTRETVGSGP